jgi:hypothetical protein
MTVGRPSATIMDSYSYLTHYHTAAESKPRLLEEPPVALKRVVTDEYFRLALAAKPKNDKDLVGKVREENARVKARTLAWSLAYFLAQKRLDGLLRYQEELSKLPRDMEFDGPTLLLCFARAFDLVDPAHPRAINEVKLANLARDWDSYIITLPLEAKVLLEEAKKNENELKVVTPPGKPPVPGGPGAPGVLPGRGQ